MFVILCPSNQSIIGSHLKELQTEPLNVFWWNNTFKAETSKKANLKSAQWGKKETLTYNLAKKGPLLNKEEVTK